jgi:hypothetical protein
MLCIESPLVEKRALLFQVRNPSGRRAFSEHAPSKPKSPEARASSGEKPKLLSGAALYAASAASTADAASAASTADAASAVTRI